MTLQAIRAYNQSSHHLPLAKSNNSTSFNTASVDTFQNMVKGFNNAVDSINKSTKIADFVDIRNNKLAGIGNIIQDSLRSLSNKISTAEQTINSANNNQASLVDLTTSFSAITVALKTMGAVRDKLVEAFNTVQGWQI